MKGFNMKNAKEQLQTFFQKINFNPKDFIEKLKAEKEAKMLAEWRYEVLTALMEGVADEDVPLFKTILNNQLDFYIKNQEMNGKTAHSAPSNRISKMLAPIVRRVLYRLTIRKLIPCQPMNGPVGLAYKLRYKEQPAIEEDDSESPEGHPAQGQQGRRLSLEVVKATLEARTHKLSACYAIEPVEDIKVMCGLDIEAEISQALAAEVADEINGQWIWDLRRIATEETETITTDEHLPYVINRQCNRIAIATRRGAGNWLVMHPDMHERFCDNVQGNNTYELLPEDKFASSWLKHVGVYLKNEMNDGIQVYESVNMPDNEILIGYKGRNGEVDGGVIYAPYIPLMNSGIVLNPDTFEPIMGFMTRAGVHSDERSADYYRKVIIEKK